MPAWHAEVTLLQLRLRRYDAADTPEQAAAMFAARAPYQAVASVEIKDGRAWVDGMLVAGQQMSRRDRVQISELLRKHGAVVLDADRHGHLVQRER